MPDRAKKKERQRLKRKEKQTARRKAASISPFAKLAKSVDEVRFWWNPTYPENHQAQVIALCSTKGGRHAVAVFLVDLGVLGVKDVFGRLDITPSEFHDRFWTPTDDQIGLAQVAPEQARALIAGGIRFAHENGFRLPKDLDRWLGVIGGVGDWRTADTSQFSKEFAGSLDELRQRLIGQSPDAFLKREDITFILREDGGGLIDDFGDFEVELDAIDELIPESLQDSVREQLDEIMDQIEESGQELEPELTLAYATYMAAMVKVVAQLPNLRALASPFSEEAVSHARQMIQDQWSEATPQFAEEMCRAFGQLHRYFLADSEGMDPRLIALADPTTYIMPVATSLEAIGVNENIIAPAP